MYRWKVVDTLCLIGVRVPVRQVLSITTGTTAKVWRALQRSAVQQCSDFGPDKFCHKTFTSSRLPLHHSTALPLSLRGTAFLDLGKSAPPPRRASFSFLFLSCWSNQPASDRDRWLPTSCHLDQVKQTNTHTRAHPTFHARSSDRTAG